MSINNENLVYVSNRDIKAENKELVSAESSLNVKTEKNNTEVAVVKKEYSIIGDAFFASIDSDLAPEWLTSIVDNVVQTSINGNFNNYDILVQDVRNAIDTLNVAENTYVKSINIQSIVDGIIATELTTLNATYGGVFATKVELTSAIATSESATLFSVSDSLASFSDTINSRITNVELAYAGADAALASNISNLTSAFEDQESLLLGNADAVSGLQTFVGLTGTNSPSGTGLLSRVGVLENQVDGVIVYYSGQYDVMINVVVDDVNQDNDELDTTKEPYASWAAEDSLNNNEEIRNSHIGDIFIQYDTNGDYEKSYKFIKTAQDLTDPFSTDDEGYTWALVLDTDANAAYSIALQARDLADNKRRVFLIQPFAPYDEGDLWVDSSSTPQVIKVSTASRAAGFSSLDWILADQQAQDFIDNTYTPEVSQLRRQLDGKIEYFFYESYTEIAGAVNELSALNLIDNAWNTQALRDDANGNVVYFKDSTNAYWYGASSNSWSVITDTSIYRALQESANAKASADGKVSQFYAWGGIGQPSNYITNPDAPVGDQITALGSNFYYWFKTSENKLYYKPSSSWVQVPETINGNKYISEGDIVNVLDPLTGDLTLYTYNGTSWQVTGPLGIISKSRFFVDLENEVLGPNGAVASGLSTLEATSEAYTDGEVTKVNNSFSYDSTIKIGNSFYKTGFGLDSSGTQDNGDGTTPATAFDSEFWVNAERFAIVNPSDPTIRAVFRTQGQSLVLGIENTEATKNEPRGNYSTVVDYAKGDIVLYAGASYIALRNSTNKQPNINSSDWQLLAERGEDGDSATVTDNGNGSYTISSGGNSITVSDGNDGNDAPIPTFTTNPDGSLTINPNNGQSSVTIPAGEDGATPQLNVDYFVAGGNYVSTIFRNATTRPSTPPTNQGSFDGSSETFPTGWTDNPADYTPPSKRWVSTRQYQRNPSTSIWSEAGSWSTPSLQASSGVDGEDGEPGQPGGEGSRGPGNFTIATTTGIWASSLAQVLSEIPNGVPVENDIVSIFKITDPTVGESRKYNGTTWVPFALIINGNLLVDGSVDANALSADSINGKIIVGSTIQSIGSNYMIVTSGTPFGPDNLIEWYGSIVGNISNGSAILSNLNKGNAKSWKDDSGMTFNSGVLIAGTLATSRSDASFSNSLFVSTGPFQSNGGQIVIKVSLGATYSPPGLISGTCPTTPPNPRATITVRRGSTVVVPTFTVSGTYFCQSEGGGLIATGSNVFHALEYTDNLGTTANREYNATVNLFDVPLSTNISTRGLSIMTQES